MPTITDPKQFLKMSGDELDELFRNSPAGEIPTGKTDGLAIVASGTKISDEIAHFVNIFTWKGKIFEPEKGQLINRIGLIEHPLIVANVYKGKSWFDDKECIVIDYSKTSILARSIRDEIREVAPGIYLGLVYLGKKKLIHFALKFPASS
jgi:hypothetical protein